MTGAQRVRRDAGVHGDGPYKATPFIYSAFHLYASDCSARRNASSSDYEFCKPTSASAPGMGSQSTDHGTELPIGQIGFLS